MRFRITLPERGRVMGYLALVQDRQACSSTIRGEACWVLPRGMGMSSPEKRPRDSPAPMLQAPSLVLSQQNQGAVE